MKKTRNELICEAYTLLKQNGFDLIHVTDNGDIYGELKGVTLYIFPLYTWNGSHCYIAKAMDMHVEDLEDDFEEYLEISEGNYKMHDIIENYVVSKYLHINSNDHSIFEMQCAIKYFVSR